MDPFLQAVSLIQKAHNILILPPNQPEENNLEAVLDLYYTLKKIGKNVNLTQREIKDHHLSQEKEFILSINIGKKEIKKMYYEQNGDSLNIHLGFLQGDITKNDISLREKSRIQPKIDLIITLGQKDINWDKNNFSFFSQSPIINIDNDNENKIFGQANLVFPNLPLKNIISKLIEKIEEDENLFNKSLFRRIIEKLSFVSSKNLYFVTLQQKDFQETKSKPKDIASAIRELKLNPHLNLPNLVLLWEYHHSPLVIKGVCFDGKEEFVQKILNHFQGKRKGKSALFQIQADDLQSAQEKLFKIL